MDKRQKPTILETGLEILHQQTLINGDYNKILKTAPHRYLDNMKLGTKPVYDKTSQLDCHSLLYNGTDETQDFAYPVNKLEIPPKKEYTNFNYAIDRNITNRLIDVSGEAIPNIELPVVANRGHNKFPSTKHLNKVVNNFLSQY